VIDRRDIRIRTVIQEGLPTMTDIPAVIALMARAQETLRSNPDDGLQWFNLLYMMVTEEIQEFSRHQRWQSPRWLEHLVVDFARLYFEGILACLDGDARAPRAWRALMDRRFTPGVANVQFAMMGINAHINRDLMLAVISAYEKSPAADHPGPAWGGPEYADFDRVNAILDEVQITAMKRMATGLLKEVVRVSRGLDRTVARRLVGSARDLAFANAIVCWRLRDQPEHIARFVDVLDRCAAAAGRALGLPTDPGVIRRGEERQLAAG
jgi:hypothetical protein